MQSATIQQEFTKNIFGLSIPVLALDVVIFTIYHGNLCLVLAKRDKEPSKGTFILPGGIAKAGFSLEENFDDILVRKTGIMGVYKEQLYSFGEPDRDTRGHIVTVAYYALVDNEVLLRTADLTRVQLIEYNSLDTTPIGFDHERIIRYAHQRLVWKFEYTNIAMNILPKQFSLSELQRVYEMILGKELDKRNFRKKILSLHMIQETGELDRDSSNRPAKLYEFKDKELKIVEVF
ncbi:MAG: NUDIX hydrolase [Candidatus Gracilibacteria bacterium]|jgi:8-oxo-dGTP diphosphatase